MTDHKLRNLCQACGCDVLQIWTCLGLVTAAPVIQDDINHTLIKEWWRSVISKHVVFSPLATTFWKGNAVMKRPIAELRNHLHQRAMSIGALCLTNL